MRNPAGKLVVLLFVAAIAASFGMVIYMKGARERELRRSTEALAGRFSAAADPALKDQIARLVEGEPFKLELVREFPGEKRRTLIFDFGIRQEKDSVEGNVERFTGILIPEASRAVPAARIRFVPRKGSANPLDREYQVMAPPGFHPSPALEKELRELCGKPEVVEIRATPGRLLLTLRWGAGADAAFWIRMAEQIESGLSQVVMDIQAPDPRR
ncbi:MAG: hypothetical protein K2X35_26375 [Bryobacteraceae bacterium]|nr:hypothetical protein [Bryobacteraceae bacterium]